MNIGPLAVGTGSAALPVAPSAAGASRTKEAGSSAAGAASRTPPTFLDGLLGAGSAGAQRRAEELGGLLTRFVRSALTGTAAASTTTASSSSSSASSGSLAFLKDARLSVEERLARLMVYLSDKYEKQLEQKLQQYAALENGKATGSTSKGKSTGSSSSTSAVKDGLTALLSKAGLGKFLSGGSLQKLLGQVAGPVLAGAATALGMPTLAPAILRAGPLIGSVASGAIQVLADGAGTTTKAKSSSSSGSTTGSTTGSSSETSEKQLMTEIQILQEKQKEMFALVSNILRSQHDTKMAVISNLR